MAIVQLQMSEVRLSLSAAYAGDTHAATLCLLWDGDHAEGDRL